MNNWIENYWTLMSTGDFESAIPLRNKHFPRSFFKYRSPSNYTIEMLKDQYLWLADIATLNDPFEGMLQFNNDQCLRAYYAAPESQKRFTTLTGQSLTPKEVQLLSTAEKPFREYIRICEERNIPLGFTEEQHLTRVQNRWKEIMEERNRHVRICSFSLVNNATLMWSHYTREHKGICIEYDFLEDDVIRPFIQPVLYRSQLHGIGLFEEYNIMQVIAANLIKSLDWGYEQEWRLTIFRQGENFPQKVNAPTPKAIYLGTRFEDNDSCFKQAIFDLVDERQIPTYQMMKHPHKFELVCGTRQ